jgi:hypothetical protein
MSDKTLVLLTALAITPLLTRIVLGSLETRKQREYEEET